MAASSHTGELSRLLFAADHAVDIAADALTRGRAHVKALIDKGDYGFATVVDVEIERLVRAHMRQETPQIPFLGEEEGGAGLMSEAVWVLDPIDGTANYADGSPLCSVSLALVRRGTPVLGVVAAPLLGERFVGVEGGGAYRNGVRIHVAEREVGDPLVALSDFAFGRKHRDTNELRFAVIEELVRRSMRLRIHGSVALDLAWLAAGRMSATVALSNLALGRQRRRGARPGGGRARARRRRRPARPGIVVDAGDYADAASAAVVRDLGRTAARQLAPRPQASTAVRPDALTTPTGRSVPGWTAIRCEIPLSAIRRAAAERGALESIVIRSLAAISPTVEA